MKRHIGSAGSANISRKPADKTSMCLLLLVLMAVLGPASAKMGQINPLKTPDASGGSRVKQRSKGDRSIKNVKRFDNIGKDRLHQTLAAEDMNKFTKVAIHQNDLDSIRFFEGLGLQNMRYLRISSSNYRNTTTRNQRPMSIRSRIKFKIYVDHLEIDTERIFEGIHSIVESTLNHLVIPLPIFAEMHGLEPVSLIAKSLRFTQVTLAVLRDSRIQNKTETRKNNIANMIEFATEMKMETLQSEATTDIVNGIISWTRTVFRKILYINIEEKGFVENEHLTRAFLDEPTFSDLPSLSMIFVNHLVLYTRIKSQNIPLYNLNTPELYIACMAHELINIKDLNNIRCRRLVPFAKVRAYVHRNMEDLLSEKISNLISWCNSRKKQLISTELNLETF